jgi:dTDP-4-amino-4,6-dideoxygalactose transaminase
LIPITKPWIGEEEAEAARRPILAGWVVQGPEVEAFESELAAALGARHACAVSSGTAALHLALRAVGVGPGDEVVTASHSFVATANSIRLAGAIPVFVDIDPQTFNPDPALIDAAITPRTRAVLCVHQMGMPCDLPRVLDVARSRDLPVIEDAACAIGSEILIDGQWQRIGRPHGVIACFSFHPRKVLTTGDGGMITTNDPELDARCRRWRNHSMERSTQVDRSPAFVDLGLNYRMTDIQAAVGRVQLARLDAAVERRRALAGRYGELLGDVPGLGLPFQPDWARSNWQSYCVRLPAGVDRGRVQRAMRDRGIATLGGIMCAHRELVYAREPWSCGVDRSTCGCAARSCARLRHSEEAQDGCVLLPLFHELTEADQEHIAAALRQALTGETPF